MNIDSKLENGSGHVARFGRGAIAAAVLLALGACGGGGGSTPAAGDDTPAVVSTSAKPTAAEAARFLKQATMGATEAEINRLTGMTYGAWFDEQFAKPATLHRLYTNQAAADLATIGQTLSPTNFVDSWWSQALGGEDQLRQRAAFALSEILVISFADATLNNQTRGVASYYDMLGEHAFGNYRQLLEAVTYHPMMGIYLSHRANQREDATTGRVPDLNFAREITQLFTIGENMLNLDGTVKMGSDGRPQLAYTGADLTGQSKVYTGLSWYAGPNTADRTSRRFLGQDPNLERDWRPMQAYDEYTPNTSYHSISEKVFLGRTIPASTKPSTDAEVTLALDTLFNHPNVGPFISKQLIQRLVTSNPSPAYVARVASKFNDNGQGVRGDLKAVWRAILLDAEARTPSTSPTYGKVMEPVLRLSNLLRAFKATSVSGRYTGIGFTDNPGTQLAQTAMSSPTVFNFFRPGYVPSSQVITDAGLVVPEMQLLNDVTVAGYTNYIRAWTALNPARDIQHNFDTEVALAATPTALVERMNLLLFSGTMPDALKTEIASAVASRVIPAAVYPAGSAASAPMAGASAASAPRAAASGASAPAAAASAPVPTNAAAILAAQRDRVYLAVFLSMASPDYLIQK